MTDAQLARDLANDARTRIEIPTKRPRQMMENLRRYAKRHYKGWRWTFARTARGCMVTKIKL